MDTMEEPIRLKAELVKTREVIAKKFRQSQNERIKREREIDETFAPAIKTIIKLMNQSDGDDNKNSSIDAAETEYDDAHVFELDSNDNPLQEEEKQRKKKQRKRPETVAGSGNKAAKRGKTLVEGKSFIPYNSNIVYEYYDDPNELCNRLRLLMSSQSAGNNNHNQEINSILEELYERGIIY